MKAGGITARDVRRFLFFMLALGLYPMLWIYAVFGAMLPGPYVALILGLIVILITIVVAHSLIKSIALNFALAALFWLYIECLALYISRGDAGLGLFILFPFTLHFGLYLIFCIFWKFEL